MSQIIHIAPDSSITMPHDDQEAFKQDVLTGFSQHPKRIQSKYFYDKIGSQLFNQITKHTDYYLTQAELEILDKAKSSLLAILGKDQPINIIELGPGEGVKTTILLEYFQQKKVACTYIPIDISAPYLEKIVRRLNKSMTTLPITALHTDYLHGLSWIKPHNTTCNNLVLFLGSSIGNFNPTESLVFFKSLRKNLKQGDYVLIGFDLRKNVDILMRAYDDSDGITRAFNLNLLHRINRELDANFKLNKFKHLPRYNQDTHAMESYIMSTESQSVMIKLIDQSFVFTELETIHVEYSYKYSLEQIQTFAQTSQFKLVETYIDSNGYFVDSLWEAA